MLGGAETRGRAHAREADRGNGSREESPERPRADARRGGGTGAIGVIVVVIRSPSGIRVQGSGL